MRPAKARRLQTSALVIFAVALCVRLVHVWQMRDTLFFSVLMGDSRGYDAWARQIAAGDWMGREVFYQAPLYPVFPRRDLRRLRSRSAGRPARAGGRSARLSCVALGYAGARLISPRGRARWPGLMLALYPPAIFFDGLLQKSVLDVFFVCVSLALVART